MSKNNCEVIRQELDELMLGDTYSTDALDHLRDCASCREFNEKQTRLRQIVGSLGTVSAPPDFDFRLRARLADNANGAFHFWPVVRRAVTFAVVLFVFVLGALLVRNAFNRPAPDNKQLATTEQHNATPAPQPEQRVEPREEQKPAPEFFASAPQRRPPTIRNVQAVSRSKRPLTSEAFSGEGAPVIHGVEPAGTFEVMPLDTALQSFKVSVDDGRGNARTISVPSISFGSQRMLQTGNQYVSKRDW